MTQAIINPMPLWLDIDGSLLDGGYVYIGEAGNDPQAAPLATFWDEDLTQATGQLRTRGGYIIRGANPSPVYIAAEDYSVRARSLSLNEVLYRASATSVAGVAYQPLDSDLTAIAALSTTAYGRALLALSNQAALKAATGIPDPLPIAGGTVTGNINRASAGAHLYHTNSALGSGRVFLTALGAADPTSLAGDIWLEKQ